MSSALYEKAKSHIDRGEVDQGAQALIEFLDSDPAHWEAAFILGGAFLQKRHPGIAMILTRFAMERRKKTTGQEWPEAYRNLGAAFRMMNKKPEAEGLWKMGLALADHPRERATLLGCLATAHVNEGTPDLALDYSGQAVALEPGNAMFRYNQSLAQLELGQWREGWEGYEQRFATDDGKMRQYGKLPYWDGTPGKKLIVWGEQGVGDEILFASCLPDLLKVCPDIIIDGHPRLVKLYERSFPGIKVHGTRKQFSGVSWLEDCGAEAHVSLSSLPHHFRNRDADFPGTPYLKAGAIGVPPAPRAPRIGISWMGGTFTTRADLRSIPLIEWEPIIGSLPDADWYSLQYGDTAAKHVCAFQEDTGIPLKHYSSRVECNDYDKTASFIDSMDLVITVCTTAYHVSGAMGVPVWCLVPSKPAWRYGIRGDASPWYGSARFFRQEGDDWGPVIKRVAAELKAHRFV